ncbi:hypothetical protein Q0P47_13805, partial [Staphylococcus aureus]|nr:hypothetical protein [Staphylococcus aureus]
MLNSESQDQTHKSGLIKAEFAHNIQLMATDRFATTMRYVGDTSGIGIGNHHRQYLPFAAGKRRYRRCQHGL